MTDTAIRDVGETLVELLRSELGALVTDTQQITLISPAEAYAMGGVRLTLYLYSITPTAELRNEPNIRVSSAVSQRAPLPLDLYYLLTAFAPQTITNPTDRALEAHRLLGAAMRVMHDNGTVTGAILKGNLPRDEELRVTLQPITVEDLTRIWSVFPDSALQPSISYLVTPARIASSLSTTVSPVVDERTDVDQMVPTNKTKTP